MRLTLRRAGVDGVGERDVDAALADLERAGLRFDQIVALPTDRLRVVALTMGWYRAPDPARPHHPSTRSDDNPPGDGQDGGAPVWGPRILVTGVGVYCVVVLVWAFIGR